MVLLKPDPNCLSGFTLPWVDKVTTETWNFVLVIVNVGTWFATVPATKNNLYTISTED